MSYSHNVKHLPIPCGTKIFMVYKGGLRQAIYRGFNFDRSHICGGGEYIQYVFYFGKEIGEVVFDSLYTNKVYRTLEDFDNNIVLQPKEIDDDTFNSLYMKGQRCFKKGSNICTYAISTELKPCRYATGAYAGWVREDKVTRLFVHLGGEEMFPNNCTRYYQTAKECEMNYRPKVIMLDED